MFFLLELKFELICCFFCIGGEVNFDDLTLEEKKRFQRAVASGELSKMIEPWDPWCLKPTTGAICLGKDGTRLVQPMANQEASVSLEEHLETNE